MPGLAEGALAAATAALEAGGSVAAGDLCTVWEDRAACLALTNIRKRARQSLADLFFACNAHLLYLNSAQNSGGKWQCVSKHVSTLTFLSAGGLRQVLDSK